MRCSTYRRLASPMDGPPRLPKKPPCLQRTDQSVGAPQIDPVGFIGERHERERARAGIATEGAEAAHHFVGESLRCAVNAQNEYHLRPCEATATAMDEARAMVVDGINVLSGTVSPATLVQYIRNDNGIYGCPIGSERVFTHEMLNLPPPGPLEKPVPPTIATPEFLAQQMAAAGLRDVMNADERGGAGGAPDSDPGSGSDSDDSRQPRMERAAQHTISPTPRDVRSNGGGSRRGRSDASEPEMPPLGRNTGGSLEGSLGGHLSPGVNSDSVRSAEPSLHQSSPLNSAVASAGSAPATAASDCSVALDSRQMRKERAAQQRTHRATQLADSPPGRHDTDDSTADASLRTLMSPPTPHSGKYTVRQAQTRVWTANVIAETAAEAKRRAFGPTRGWTSESDGVVLEAAADDGTLPEAAQAYHDQRAVHHLEPGSDEWTTSRHLSDTEQGITAAFPEVTGDGAVRTSLSDVDLATLITARQARSIGMVPATAERRRAFLQWALDRHAAAKPAMRMTLAAATERCSTTSGN